MVDITAGTITHGVSTTITVGVDTDMVDLALAWDTVMADIMDMAVTVDTGTTLITDTGMAVTTEVVTDTLNETLLTTKLTDVQIQL
jgi:hypothetical protein